MLIKKLELLNFRQFRKSEILFSQDEFRNVTVIMGENGAGKTTLAQSIQWALYGETAFNIKEVINRDIRQQMTSGRSITVSVAVEVEYDGRDYIIKRSQIYGKIGGRIVAQQSEMRICVKDDNGILEYLAPNRAAYMIKQMLPKELSRFFFFDGERINEMSKEIEEGKSNEFKTAVHGLTGLTATRNALAHLKREDSVATIIGRLDKKIYVDSMSNIKAERYDKEIQELRERRKILNERQEEIELKINSYEKKAEELNFILMSASNDMVLKDRYNKLGEEINNCEKYKHLHISNALLPLIDKEAYCFIAAPLIKTVISELSGIEEFDKSIPKLSRDTLLHILQRRECLCGCRLEVGTDEFNRVNELINYVPPKSISMQTEEFKKTAKRIKDVSFEFFEALTARMQTVRKYEEDIDIKQQEASELLDCISDTTKGEIARKELNDVKRNLGMLRREYAENEVKADSLRRDIERKETEKEKLVIITDNTKRLMLYRGYAERIYNDLSASYKSKEEETRILLEKKINDIFADIYDGNISIAVDGKYNIRVASVNKLKIDDNLEKNTAQSYAIIFAFITAIIAIAKEKAMEAKKDANEDSFYIETDGYPLVMDAPLSAFDKTRIQKICKTMPAIAKQVIIFIKDTDGEVAEEYMSDVIGAKYIVEKENGSNLYSGIERR